MPVPVPLAVAVAVAASAVGTGPWRVAVGGRASDSDSVGDSRRPAIDDDVCLTMNTYLSYYL